MLDRLSMLIATVLLAVVTVTSYCTRARCAGPRWHDGGTGPA